MKDARPYLHVLDGRLRVKVPEVKRSEQNALRVQQVLDSLQGVIRVTANPTTGNVLVLFHFHIITHAEILFALREAGFLRQPIPERAASFHISDHVVTTVSHAIARSVTEALMERALLALL